MEAVLHTFIEAVVLVVLVVVLFLQNWRAAVIPLLAIPVSIIGTFAILLALGFTLNSLTMFGLILAIGIVVDDAIVVVENAERHMAPGLSPLEAARKTMDEVGFALIAIALVLVAVFVPTAFISGISGAFYRQFAVDHLGRHRALGDRVADPLAGPGRAAAEAARAWQADAGSSCRSRCSFAASTGSSTSSPSAMAG